ncbi:unnamed protein product, partial [Mesorhabditis belari]|uniref:Cytochrome b5 heme-binding domain-containing protein n=1 Tax=Mesorhabditis belari TaxID=2138241 RepID=A0AAF3FDD7_9BILA
MAKITQRRISREEVAEHCDYASCWIVLHNDVLDVTEFLEKHPGSMELLLEYAGSDATQVFEDCGHSMQARMLADKYKIGTLPDEQQPDQPGSQFVAYAKKLVQLISA